jgi:gliding motility-associated-like protein
MKTIFKLLVLYLALSFGTSIGKCAKAQGEYNNMIFGTGIGYDFGAGTPQFFDNNLFPMYGASATISDASGQLLFYTNGFWVWNRNHHLFPELTNGISGYASPTAQTVGYPPLMPHTGGNPQQATTIVKKPGSQHLYYIFSLSSSGVVYYSLVDMTLNNGLGGIVAGHKGIYLYHGFTEKMNVVAGCDNVWLVGRSKLLNEYHALEIRDTGIVSTPVISTVGLLPIDWYRTGSIRFSADGTMMAAACGLGTYQSSGIELYDFDKVNGIVSNARVLDSGSVSRCYYGVCFSEDGSKLYATESSFYQYGYYGTFYPGKLRQFDLSLGSTAAISASNTILYTEPTLFPERVGDVQRAADGKVYFSSAYGNVPFHVVQNPNLPGIAAGVQIAGLSFPQSGAKRAMPNDIAIAPIPDTVTRTIPIAVCYQNSITLQADSGRHYTWSNGASTSGITVFTEGTYVAEYTNMHCQRQIDSFVVSFYELPSFVNYGYSCPGRKQGKMKLLSMDTFHYQLYKGSSLLAQATNASGFEKDGLDTGTYTVHLSAQGVCDTILSFTIQALPVPIAAIDADSIICAGREAAFAYTGDAPVYQWLFSNSAVSIDKEVSTIFYDTGKANARLIVTNVEGCSDTAIFPIDVKGLNLKLKASEHLAAKGSSVILASSAAEPYAVLRWEPQALFGAGTEKSKTVVIDSTTTFYVHAVSDFGCEATAEVTVEVLSEIVMPNAFTPNGDGRNDRFAPVIRGSSVIRKFEVYNRWGQAVFSAWGQAATEGWDGTFNGKPCDVGTYYYYINIEIQKGKTVMKKGDVLLMR